MPSYVKAYLGTTPLFTETPTSSADWVRPADWLTLPTATANSVRGLYAVFDQTENYVTIHMATADNSTYTIDWGDGTTTPNAASSVTQIKNYNYANAALDGTLSTRGYKQAIITVTPQAGKVFTLCRLDFKPTTPTGLLNGMSSGWLDLNLNLPNLTTGGRLYIGGVAFIHRLLERVNITSWGALTVPNDLFRNTLSLASLNETEWNFANITTPTSMFYTSGIRRLNCENWDMRKVNSISNIFRDCKNLQSVKCSTWNLSACTNLGQVFMACQNLEDVDVSNWNVSNVTQFPYVFQDCRSLKNINVANWNTAKAQTINNMFEACPSLVNLITTNWNLSACTNASSFINSCPNLRNVGPLNLSNVTTLTASNANVFAANCNSLANVAISGIKATVNFSNCQMSASTLNTLYTNLATVVGQTITVTGNYGTASDDPTIATGKGWTVTG